jgi:hypothetical protein
VIKKFGGIERRTTIRASGFGRVEARSGGSSVSWRPFQQNKLVRML